ncbi:hypothetical protein [Kitasatospora fiedleri]|uniref:hypothetical protein n=1 Tax=Kitasatospora fiedleri TaxID=2991545 RepID=UPI00249A6203|nr:hypothetical protein [Kitasatospora fiedleri]
MASGENGTGGHDRTALDEIDLTGELMIAASASRAERLAAEQIDEVLLAPRGGPDRSEPRAPEPRAPEPRAPEARAPQQRTPERGR